MACSVSAGASQRTLCPFGTGLTVSAELIERFRQEKGFVHYLPTSALTGAGCQELHRAIVNDIDWTGIPLTASPDIFRRLKDAIIRLRDEGMVLLRMSEFGTRRSRMGKVIRLSKAEIRFWQFTSDELHRLDWPQRAKRRRDH